MRNLRVSGPSRTGKRRSRHHGDDTDKSDSPRYWQILTAELVGTFFLTLSAILPVHQASSPVSHLEKALPSGLVVCALILAIGPTSGAHFNPAVTMAFFLRQAFSLKKVPSYITAQIMGAVLAASLAAGLARNRFLVGQTHPLVDPISAVVIEAVLTTLLVLVILGTANNHRLVGNNAALAVGAAICLSGMIGRESGPSLNPARSLGPAIVSGDFADIWIYLLGPLLGVGIAVVLTTILVAPANADEAQEARGRDQRLPGDT
ncbi:MAG: hypothetical protein C5B53_10175 [Candidatus Melainabacteria bacterium]|nr:MAG: hypothetical protein C5B53_10175 [Candidatus Melainabacteria bacterium]